MPLTSAANLVDALRKYQLLEPKQFEVVSRELQNQFSDPRSLAKELIDRGWLTPYQVNQLLQDRGQELVLGAHILLERLGTGGMGEVYKARHAKMNRLVALKVIRKERLSQAGARRWPAGPRAGNRC